jgi:glycosyltransferase involved in cell wall biosynthesis
VRIVQVSTQQDGGAGRAARRLHDGLRQIGHDSIFFVRDLTERADGVVAFDSRANVFRRGVRSARRRRIEADFAVYRKNRSDGQEVFGDDRSELRADVRLHLPASDIVNLHWVTGFIDYSDFLSQVPPRVPVVWTLHDMNPFTGGCHYDRNCGKFVDACGSCPELGSKDEADLSRRIWQRKSRTVRKIPPGRLQIVADSNWLASKAKESSLFGGFPVEAIHYSLDVGTFAPRDRAAARLVLGLPANAKIILFVADHPNIRRKGFATLAEALTGLPAQGDLLLLSMGRDEPEVSKRFSHLHLGYVTQERFQSIIYSAADIFVIPSLQEAFGQTALESMACGTPVVGSDAGGIPEIVRDGVTGLLFPVGDARSLAAAMVKLLEDDKARAMIGKECRRVAVEEYSLEIQAKRYANLYRKVLRGNE